MILDPHKIIEHYFCNAGTTQGKVNAAGALRYLAFVADNQVRIVQEGGLGALISLSRYGSPEGKANAADALWYIYFLADNQVSIDTAGGLAPLIELLTNG